MNNTDQTHQKKPLVNGEIALFLRGLIIGKVLTIIVIGGLFWWLVKPRIWNSMSADPSVQTQTAPTFGTTFGTVADVPTGAFNYGGSTAWVPIRQLVDAQIQNDRPELQLHYLSPTNASPSSNSGIRMVLDGQLDFAQSSRPLTAEDYAIAKQRGFTLAQHQIGIDGIAVVVNPSLNVSGLTIDQLQQIYMGQITNWKQVGGPDLTITPLSLRPEDTDIVLFPSSINLKRQVLGSNVHYVNSTTEALRQVRKTPGSLYYASARAVVPQCSVKPLPLGRTPTTLIPPYRQPLVPSDQCPHQRNQINTEAIKNGSYPITASLFVITKHNKGKEEQAGVAYAKLLLTDQGQKALEQAGFTGVR
ncbi:MAG: substrate-binding domain-containing protein [Stigonema ocellatum SAG 48.90 = DSM 106950]|nr:substrate-binding domain-containing protein [Stigonema ocellatum SAG 48.90 = DSM 106950]